MKSCLSLWLCSLTVLTLLGLCRAGASTVAIVLPAFAKECVYYPLNDEADELVINYQVLSGGNFELDFEITSPRGDSVIHQKNEKYADFLLRTFGIGDYSFCFSNPYNAIKKVEFSIELQTDKEFGKKLEKDAVVADNSISEIDRQLTSISKSLNYLRAREWRNVSTVKSTESRVVWLSIITILLTVGISVGQATIVQFMFTAREKNYV